MDLLERNPAAFTVDAALVIVDFLIRRGSYVATRGLLSISSHLMRVGVNEQAQTSATVWILPHSSLLGFAARFAKSDLKLPEALYETLSIYLLLTIGQKVAWNWPNIRSPPVLPQAAAAWRWRNPCPAGYPALDLVGRLKATMRHRLLDTMARLAL